MNERDYRFKISAINLHCNVMLWMKKNLSVVQLTPLKRMNVICCHTKDQHYRLWGGKKTTLFIHSAALLNHYIDANPAKFNPLRRLLWILDAAQISESVAEKQQRSFLSVRRPASLDRCTASAWSTVTKLINVLRTPGCQIVPRHATQTNQCPPISLVICDYVGCKKEKKTKQNNHVV